MRFMIVGKATRDTEAGVLPPPGAFAAMEQYHEELVAAGILLGAEGLAPSAKGAREKSAARRAQSSTARSPKRKS